MIRLCWLKGFMVNFEVCWVVVEWIVLRFLSVFIIVVDNNKFIEVIEG